MDDTKKLKINIDPVGKGRPRFTANGHTYTDAKTRAFEMAIRNTWARRHGMSYSEVQCPVEVSIRVAKALPKSGRGSFRFDLRAPDLDNCAKAILDGLNGMAFADDKQIVKLTVERMAPESYTVGSWIEIEVGYHWGVETDVWPVRRNYG